MALWKGRWVPNFKKFKKVILLLKSCDRTRPIFYDHDVNVYELKICKVKEMPFEIEMSENNITD